MSDFGEAIENLTKIKAKELYKRIKKVQKKSKNRIILEEHEDLSAKLIKTLLKNNFAVAYLRFPYKVNRQWQIVW